MKNPNKYGTVTKLSGNRRRPYVAKEGVSGLQKPIGYAETKEGAMLILAQYNANPWDIEANKITFRELFTLWVEKRADKLGKSNRNCLCAAYKHCRKLDGLQYKTIKAYQMQDCIDTCGRSYSTQADIKSLFGHLDDFALELDIVTKGYSSLLHSAPTPETSKKPFTDEEVSQLWRDAAAPWVDSVLFLLYTGYRISEMLQMQVHNVDLEGLTMTGGVKTEAGKNRIMPIHSKIVYIVKRRYAMSQSGYLFEHDGKPIPDHVYRTFWKNIMQANQMQHTPHECRHTFRTRLDKVGANEVCIDRLMGHVSQSTGRKVYTHKDIEELRRNLELITN